MITDFSNNLKRVYWQLMSKTGRRLIRERLKKKLISLAAFIWRRLLINTTFIAVSGSVGKTTTKELLAAILEQHRPTVRTPGNWNLQKTGGIEATILRTRPWHRFAVVEIGIEKPGDMRSAAKLLKPNIALMLSVKRCHTNVFKTLQAIMNEKSQLLHSLGRNGCVVINQDDVHVAQMASNLECKIIQFGSGKDADFRLLSAQSRWPNRLTLEIQIDETIYKIATGLVGTHWTPTIMASLATATKCGVPLKEAINTIKSIDPFWARMQPITLPSYGATIIRDEWNGSIDTFETALTVMEEADATRKIVIFSDYSDSMKKLRTRANHLGKIAARIADMAIFVGDYSDRSVQAAISEGLDREHTHGFFSLSSATEFLKNELRKGDLVLIKGQANHHLSRVYLGLLGEVKCAKLSCSKQILCDNCYELGFDSQKGYMESGKSAGGTVSGSEYAPRGAA